MHVAVQNTLQSMPNIGTGNVKVTAVSVMPYMLGYRHTYTIEFVGVFAGIDVTSTDPNIGVAGELLGFIINSETGQGVGAQGNLVTERQTGTNTTVNERQAITFDYLPSGGTWTLTFKSQTTADLAYNISAVDLQTALEALSNIGVGDVDVISTTTPSGVIVWTVNYTGALAAKDQPDLLIDTSGLTGGPAVVVQTQQGAKGTTKSNSLHSSIRQLAEHLSFRSMGKPHPTSPTTPRLPSFKQHSKHSRPLVLATSA